MPAVRRWTAGRIGIGGGRIGIEGCLHGIESDQLRTDDGVVGIDVCLDEHPHEALATGVIVGRRLPKATLAEPLA